MVRSGIPIGDLRMTEPNLGMQPLNPGSILLLGLSSQILEPFFLFPGPEMCFLVFKEDVTSTGSFTCRLLALTSAEYVMNSP